MDQLNRLFLTVSIAVIAGCAGLPQGGTTDPSLERSGLDPIPSSVDSEEADEAVAVEGLAGFGITDPVARLSSLGAMIDVRFTVVDEFLARRILNRDVPVHIVDRSTGVQGAVINTPKVGALRNTGMPVEGRIYFTLFSNPGMSRGAILDLEFGDDAKLAGLVLQ
jgi:hypothetical protein